MTDQVSNAATLPAVFTPPPGGDLTIRSTDGHEFLVHSVILGLASTIFSDMFTIGVRTGEPINLSDDTESISVMLGYIYPLGVPPFLATIELLEKGLQIAQKYDVRAVLDKLDRALSTESSYRELVCSSPLDLFHLAVKYELRDCRKVAARAVNALHCDLATPLGLTSLAEQYPHASYLIGLVGLQSARAEMLFKFFYSYVSDNGSVVINNTPEDGDSWLVCEDCLPKLMYGRRIEAPVSYYPVWLTHWGLGLYDEIYYEDLDEGKHGNYFIPSILDHIRINKNLPYCQDCVNTARTAKGGRVFEEWADGVKDKLKSRLRELDSLYELI